MAAAYLKKIPEKPMGCGMGSVGVETIAIDLSSSSTAKSTAVTVEAGANTTTGLVDTIIVVAIRF